ncbi:N-6 DNA methylase [Acuticoccus mangrovi]|uniref:N-6 DNA methylase n=1 Tax=Acuticoccus mangrovi TaxID=2796142 RepID=A0A934MJZ8_9HYPH|nr:N-6 DNA methylase [Acuticoccus mangrovi]
MRRSEAQLTLIKPAAVIVQQGKLLDYIDGVTQRNETPEEYVRQEIAKSLVREYGYEKAEISVEFTLRLGSKKPRADLVIFDEGDPHDQDRARVIIECKSQKIKSTDRKEGVGQLQSYMSACPNVAYGMWTNGVERFCYRRVDTNGKIAFEEIPDIPGKGRTEDEVERPRFDQLKAASSDALLFAFRRCHNYIAGNQGLQKPEAFWELLKIIFCKIHDERSSDEVEFYATSKERHGLNGRLKAKKRLDTLFNEVKAEYPTIFRENEAIELNPEVLAYIVSQLQMYSLLESDIDVKGRAYEEIVGSNLRGDRGEFFTPRNICQMTVAMLDPGERQVILDPACGTGGFLITAMNYVIEKIRSAEISKWGDVERAETAIRQRVQRFAQNYIVGMDLNPNLVKASKMNMVMNNDGAGGLFQANSLKAPATWDDDLRARQIMGQVDLIFTNPPFGSKIPIDEPSILEAYDLGHIWSYDADTDRWTRTNAVQKSQPPEILFIERCVKFLKPGTGRCAIVLPDGILGSPGLGYVREWILQNTRVLASIDLHPDTFQPHVSVQTSVLVLERKTDEEIAVETAAGRMNDYEVFMAVANHIGHDKRGNVTYVRDKKGNEIVEEIEETLKEYEEGKPVYKKQRTRRKVIDDNTLQIAQAFRTWLSEQD